MERAEFSISNFADFLAAPCGFFLSRRYFQFPLKARRTLKAAFYGVNGQEFRRLQAFAEFFTRIGADKVNGECIIYGLQNH